MPSRLFEMWVRWRCRAAKFVAEEEVSDEGHASLLHSLSIKLLLSVREIFSCFEYFVIVAITSPKV